MTARRRQHVRDRQRGRLPGPRRHERNQRVLPRRVQGGPGPATTILYLTEQQPDLRRSQPGGVGASKGAAQLHRLDRRAHGLERVQAGVVSERRDWIPRLWTMKRDLLPDNPHGRPGSGDQHHQDEQHQPCRGPRPSHLSPVASDGQREVEPESVNMPAGQDGGEPRGHPDDPQTPDRCPATEQDHPATGRPGVPDGSLRAQCPAHDALPPSNRSQPGDCPWRGIERDP
jgi:hypothetical protein